MVKVRACMVNDGVANTYVIFPPYMELMTAPCKDRVTD